VNQSVSFGLALVRSIAERRCGAVEITGEDSRTTRVALIFHNLGVSA
jgi:hypothetical protein